MTKTFIRGGDIITLDRRRNVLRGADAAVMGGSLVAVGAAPAHFEPDEIIDAR